MKFRSLLCVLTLVIASRHAVAADYTIAPLAEPAPADELSEEIAAELLPEGYRVLRKGRPYCDLWLRKQWPAKKDFTASQTVLYPFEIGALVGVIHYHRRGGDFRDQDIDKGVYTMRYAQQPVDGNHVGTSDTQDFMLLSLAEDDTDAGSVELESLFERSADAAQSAHPCMLSLLRTPDSATPPTLTHDEDRELWSVQLPVATTTAPDDTLIVTLVLVGYTEE